MIPVSSRELFELRNNIPMEMLIKDRLQLPSKISEGVFRFLCPVCNEFQTGINPATNLARCFRCDCGLMISILYNTRPQKIFIVDHSTSRFKKHENHGYFNYINCQ
jgi:hypothetical protein